MRTWIRNRSFGNDEIRTGYSDRVFDLTTVTHNTIRKLIILSIYGSAEPEPEPEPKEIFTASHYAK
jgi:hypothetical protein